MIQINNLKFNSVFSKPKLTKYEVNNNSVLSNFRKSIIKDKEQAKSEIDELTKLSTHIKNCKIK